MRIPRPVAVKRTYKNTKMKAGKLSRDFSKPPRSALIEAVLEASASYHHVLVITDSHIKPVLMQLTGARETRRWLVRKDSRKRQAPHRGKGHRKPDEAAAWMISIVRKGWSLKDLRGYPPQVIVVDGSLTCDPTVGRWSVNELMPFGSHACTFIYVPVESPF